MNSEKDMQPKQKNTKLTLQPMQFEEAVKAILNVKPQKITLKNSNLKNAVWKWDLGFHRGENRQTDSLSSPTAS